MAVIRTREDALAQSRRTADDAVRCRALAQAWSRYVAPTTALLQTLHAAHDDATWRSEAAERSRSSLDMARDRMRSCSTACAGFETDLWAAAARFDAQSLHYAALALRLAEMEPA